MSKDSNLLLICSGHSIAGGNLQNYLNHQQAVFKDHRSAQGLNQESRGDPVTSRRRSTLDPVIQQQIDHITAKVQKQHFLESYTMFTYQNQHNPMFTDFINSTTPEEVWNARPWGPLGTQADISPYPSAVMPFSPEQASPGIFSPTPQQTGHAQPVPYSLPAPPAPIYTVHHDEREPKHQEFNSKPDDAEAEIERLRKANSTLVKALIGTVCVSELNAIDMKKSSQSEGLKLAILAKRLSKPDPRRNARDVVDARDVALAVANVAANKFDKSALHLRELAHAKSLIHEAIVESGDEEALALWDARKGTWPFEDRFWRR